MAQRIPSSGGTYTVGSQGKLPSVFPAVIVGVDRGGDVLAEPLEWAGGDKPRITIPTQRRDRSPPGIGDHVLLKIEGMSRERGRKDLLGRVLKVLEAKPSRELGVFQRTADGRARLVPVQKKRGGRELLLNPLETADIANGELIVAETTPSQDYALPTGRVIERLGDVSSEKAASLIAIHAHGIATAFPPEALAEAAAAKTPTLKGREDWRALPLITIDPADAKDHDDAVHAAYDDNPANEGGFVLSIAIADVASYVTPGSALDREAQSRGNSVYFPDRVVPMLPERISNDLCSLVPDRDRPALAVRVWLSAGGEKLRHSFHRILMRSHAKLAYERAQAIMDGAQDEHGERAILAPLYEAYRALSRARDHRGPLELDLPERKLVLDDKGRVADVVLKERLDAHRLIEEMMILANVCAAETLIDRKQILLFRIHDEPALSKLESLRTFLRTLDVELPKSGAVKPQLFNRLLVQFKDTDQAALVNDMVLRSQAQAEYAPDNIGHFGLSLRKYAHFTSPIRRYADLIVHRGLIRALELGNDGLPDMPIDRLREIGTAISAAERRAMEAERDTIDRLIAFHLADQVGSRFPGRVSGVTKSGLFVKLDRLGADGFIPAATLGQDYFRFDDAAMALVGDRTGESYQLGDRVEVRLSEAQPLQGRLTFEILSEGRYRKPVNGRRGARRRTGDERGMRTPPKGGAPGGLAKGRKSRGR